MSFNLIENGQRFCKKLNLNINRVTAENVVVDFTGIDGLEIYYANLYRKDDPTNQAAGVISGTEVILGNVEPACYKLKVCFEVVDKAQISCPLNFVGNLTYDNCGGVPVVYPIYHECTDCSAIHDCVVLSSPDGSIDVQWNPETQEWEIQDLIDVDTDQTWQGYLNDTDPENPLICFNIVDEISGNVTGEDVVCIPASNGDIEDNGDGTATITIDGEQVVVCTGPCATVTQTVTDGNEIAVFIGADGAPVSINETITNIFATLDTSTPGEAYFTINYTNEDGSQQPITVDLSALLDDTDTDTTYSFTETSGIITVTNLDSNSPVGVFDICAIVNANCGASIVANPDGSYTVTGNDGVSETIPKGDVSVLINTDNDQGFGVQEIGSHIADGVTTTLNETITSFVDNGDGTYTYTSEDGTVTELTAVTDVNEVVNNGDGTKTIIHTSVDGTVTTWCVPTCNTTSAVEVGENFSLESVCETQTFDISTNDTPCTSIDEDGNTVSTGQGVYLLKNVVNSDKVFITLTSDGKVQIQPKTCTEDFIVELESCIQCSDGTLSSTAVDLFEFVAPCTHKTFEVRMGVTFFHTNFTNWTNYVDANVGLYDKFKVISDPTVIPPDSNGNSVDRNDIHYYTVWITDPSSNVLPALGNSGYGDLVRAQFVDVKLDGVTPSYGVNGFTNGGVTELGGYIAGTPESAEAWANSVKNLLTLRLQTLYGLCVSVNYTLAGQSSNANRDLYNYDFQITLPDGWAVTHVSENNLTSTAGGASTLNEWGFAEDVQPIIGWQETDIIYENHEDPATEIDSCKSLKCN